MFVSDQPIDSIDQDLLGRKTFVQRLAAAIKNINSRDCYAIALQGKWGCGKTSLINMVLAEIGKDSPEPDSPCLRIIQFCPWNFTDTAQLISQFFVRLSSALKTDNKAEKAVMVGEAIERYSRAFEVAEYIPFIGQYLKAVPDLIKGIGSNIKEVGEKANDITYQKEQVEKALKELGERILIVIDDIDRLPDEQIRLIFQLVNSVAGFPNTTYLLSYDKEIVSKALDGVQGKGAEYLEKIIQIPFDVPQISRGKLQNIFEERVSGILRLQDGAANDGRWYQIFRHCVAPFLETLRDVNRVCNVLAFSYTAVKGEVDPLDMVGICSLQVLAPSIYDWIRDNKNYLLNIVYLNGVNQSEQDQNRKNAKKIFERVYNDPETMLDAVTELFPIFGFMVGARSYVPTQAELHQATRIADPNTFSLYFSLSLDEIKISRKDLNRSILEMDRTALEKFLCNLEKDGLCNDYMQELASYVKAHKVPKQRVEVLALIIPDKSYLITSAYSMREIFSVFDFIQLLFELQDEERANGLLQQLFQTANLNTFQYLMHLLHIIELSYDRIAVNPEYRDKKVITLEHLLDLEKNFLSSVHKFIQATPVLDWNQSRRGIMLWKFIAHEDYMEYMKNVLQDGLSATKYLSLSISAWQSGSYITEYSYETTYKELLTIEEALNIIERVRKECGFWAQDFDLPERMAAFVLLSSDKEGRKEIEVTAVNTLVERWKEG